MARRTVPTKLFVVLAGLLVVLTVASAVARTGPKKAPELNPRLARWAKKPHPAGFRIQLAELARAKDRKAAFRTVARQAILDLAGLSRPALNLNHEEEDFSVFVPAGDLDADGKEDAAELFFSKVVGIRGANGSALWTHELDGFGGVIGTGPLDAVAGDDVLVVDIAEQDLDVGWRWTWTYRALSGRSGQVLWTRSYENVWTVGALGNTEFYVDVDFALPYAVGDLSGDGKLDLVVGRFNIAEKSEGVTRADDAAAVTYEVVSGANGAPTAAFSATGRMGYPDAFLVPDLNGDQATDIVTISVVRAPADDYDAAIRVVAQSGKGGPPLWVHDASGYRQPYGFGVNLNADGRGDVILVTDWWQDAEYKALSGSNGAVMWERAAYDAWLEPVGDVTGDGGSELLLVEDDPWCCFPIVAHGGVKAGRADVPALPGHEVAAATPCYEECSPSPCYGDTCPTPPPPCDGEECPPTPCQGDDCEPTTPPDPCPSEGGYGYGGYTSGVTIASHYGYGYGNERCDTQSISVLNGAVGEVVWETTHRGAIELTGDATGDGVADALLEGYTLNEEANEWQWSTMLLSGRNGERGWSRVFDSGFLYPLGVDVDGDGSDDLLLLQFTGSEDRYVPISGATGQPTWSDPVVIDGWLLDLLPAALRGGPRHDLLETTLQPEWWITEGHGRAGDTGEELWKR